MQTSEIVRLAAWASLYIAVGAFGATVGSTFVGAADETRKAIFGGGEMEGLYAWESAAIGAGICVLSIAVLQTLLALATSRKWTH